MGGQNLDERIAARAYAERSGLSFHGCEMDEPSDAILVADDPVASGDINAG